MQGFDEYLYKYALHDCVFEDVITNGNQLCFDFDSGVYCLSSDRKETVKTQKCRMVVEFMEDLNPDQMWEHVEIRKIRKKKITESEYEDFIKEVRTDHFDVLMHYWSPFNNEILLEGHTEHSAYQIKLSEIRGVEFRFA